MASSPSSRPRTAGAPLPAGPGVDPRPGAPAAADLAFPLDRAGYLAAILDNTNLAAYLKDDQGRYVYVNRQYELLSTVPKEIVLGRRDEDLFPPEVARLFAEQDRLVTARRHLVEFEETIPLPGGVFSFITAKFPLVDAEGRVFAVGGVCTDITTRQHLSQETQFAERERLAVTLRSIGEGVVGTDLSGNVSLLNPAAEKLTGWTKAEALGQPVEAVVVVDPADGRAGRLGAMLDHPGTVRLDELAVTSREGTRRDVTATFAPIHDRTGVRVGAVITLRDETESARLKQELLKSSKLEALELLAGGIAHDFHNILVGILGNVELAILKRETPEAMEEHLAGVEKAALRARELTRQLLTFARGESGRRQVSAVAELVHDAASFVLCGGEVSADFDLPGDLWMVAVDRAQLAQVVQNLVINARQALGLGGHVRVGCRNRELAGPDPARSLRAGRYVEITVSDDGPGIPAALLERIFDPYFTTKEAGTGLGLAVASSVVKSHGGSIQVASTPGAGTTFTILLPATAQPLAAPPPPVVAAPRGGRVLLMDDDEVVRIVGRAMLGRLGFEVVLARNGEEAIGAYATARHGGHPFDLVLMDLTVLDGMSGLATLRELRALDPGVKAVVSSGYCGEDALADFASLGFVATLPKPFTLAELRETIGRVLA